jgi:hypothetical protein
MQPGKRMFKILSMVRFVAYLSSASMLKKSRSVSVNFQFDTALYFHRLSSREKLFNNVFTTSCLFSFSQHKNAHKI